MLRKLTALLIVVMVKALVVDRVLRWRRGGASPAPLRMLVVVDAPIEATWSVIADVRLQPEWMREMKAIRMAAPGPVRAGLRGEATVRIFGITVTDPVEVVDVEAPHRYEIRHEGLFKGGGLITLESGSDGTTTIVRWEETLVPPLLPDLGAILQAPVLRAIFQADLQLLKRLVENGAVD